MSIVDCEANRSSILDALKTIYSEEFRGKLAATINPYGEGGASEKIIDVIKSQTFHNGLKNS